MPTLRLFECQWQFLESSCAGSWTIYGRQSFVMEVGAGACRPFSDEADYGDVSDVETQIG